VERDSRSVMNAVFRLPSYELEKRFVDEAKKAGMADLKGHRSALHGPARGRKHSQFLGAAARP
jgi:phosphoserine aminotransferase